MSNPKFTVGLDIQGKEELDLVVKKLLQKYNINTDISLGSVENDIERKLISPISKAKYMFAEFGLVVNGVQNAMQALNSTFGSMVKAAQEQEKAETTIKAALRATGMEVEANAKILSEYASQMQNLTIYGDEATLEAMAKMQNMARFESIEILQQATKAAMGLAAAFQLDLTTAMDLVGKAAAGNTALLGRYGIVLDETLSQADKFNQVLGIGISYFGVAEEMAGTNIGKLEQLKNAWGDLLEVLAEGVIPVISKLSDILVPIINHIGSLTDAQRAMTMGLIILNGLVVKHTLTVMSQKAAFAALTIEQQRQVASMIMLVATQKGATLGTLTFSAAMKALWASIVAAGAAVKSFLVTIGPVGWVILGVTAAYVALTAVMKDNTATQKELNDAQLKQMQFQKDQINKRVEEEQGILKLTQRYQELVNTTNRSVSQQKELRSIHDQLSSRYPDLISSTDSYTNSLEGVKKAAHNAQLSLNDLSRQQQALSINILKTEMESLRLEALETLTKEFTYWDKRTTLTPARQSALAVLDNAKKYLRENTVESDSRLIKLGSVKDMLNRYKDDANTLYDKEMAAIYDALTSLQMIESKKSEYDRLRSQPILPTSVVDFASSVSSSQLASDPAQNIRKRLEEFELAKSVRFEEQQTELLLLEKKYLEEKKKLILTDADKLNSLKEEYEREQNLIAEKYRKKEITETEKHYNDLKFYDSTYYDWKKEALRKQSDLVLENEDERERWLNAQYVALDNEKNDWDNRVIIDFQKRYDDAMSQLNELRQLGIVSYADIAQAARSYYNELGDLSVENDVILEIYKKRAEMAEKTAAKDPDDLVRYYEQMKFIDSGYYEWKKNQIMQEVSAMDISENQKEELLKKMLSMLKADRYDSQQGLVGSIMSGIGISADQQKSITQTYQKLASQIQSIWATLYQNLEARKQESLDKLNKRAKVEHKTEVWLSAEKEKVEAEYHKKNIQMKKAEQKIQIVSAIANTAEGVTNALTLKPAFLAPIAAAAALAFGTAQVALIAQQKFWRGGLVKGKGGDTTDSNLVALSNNEFVIRASRVREIGLPFLEAINSGSFNVAKAIPTFNTHKSKPLSTTQKVVLMCDGRELAKAVTRGKRRIKST